MIVLIGARGSCAIALAFSSLRLSMRRCSSSADLFPVVTCGGAKRWPVISRKVRGSLRALPSLRGGWKAGTSDSVCRDALLISTQFPRAFRGSFF